MRRARRSSRSVEDPRASPEEINASYWNQKAQLAINDRINKRENRGIAKNVIMFLGDGMSISTLAAARVYLGGKTNTTGEEINLAFEKFPYTGMSKVMFFFLFLC